MLNLNTIIFIYVIVSKSLIHGLEHRTDSEMQNAILICNIFPQDWRRKPRNRFINPNINHFASQSLSVS